MDPRTFWNEVGSAKNFEDPLYLEKLEPFIRQESKIVEYGCGYGRLMHLLDARGYKNLIGFDFAPKMIQRGKRTYPHLNFETLEASGKIPLQNESCDVAIMSTILCCMIGKHEQVSLMEEILRILKCGGVLYLSDFLVCDHPRYADKYQEGYKSHKEWGIYTTSEGIVVRHHTTQWVMRLLEQFNVHWFEQFDFKTMNNNVARTFHCIAQKFNVSRSVYKQ